MRNPGFLKNRTDAPKGHGFIETDHGNLSVEVNLLRILFFRHDDGSLQKLRSDAPPTIAFQHRHASYLCSPSMHYDPRRSYGFPCRKSEKVKRAFVVAVHFDLFRYTLFSYEHARANGISFF